MPDVAFILRNYTGLALARCVERVPSALPMLRRTHSKLKPFIANRLRGARLPICVTETVGAFKMHLRLADDVQRQIYLGLYENDEIAIARAVIRAGATCIDVGANVGWFSLHFSQWVGTHGSVIACEADPAIAQHLTENCQLNQFANVEILNAAVSDHDGSVTFIRSSPDHSGWGSVCPQEGNRGGESISVPSRTLDAIVGDRGLSEVEFLKVDVEGHEFALLQGAEQSLKRRLFRHVLIEWAGAAQAATGRTLDQMTAIFHTAGYEPVGATVALICAARSNAIDSKKMFANLLFGRVGDRSP